MPRQSSPARAIALMISAVVLFSLMDATSKALSAQVGVLATLWVRYAGQTVLVLAIVIPRLPGVLKTRYPWLQFIRSVFLLVATACFFTGLANIGIAQAAAIMSVNPVFITLGAALFLGEKLGPRRIAGIAVALIGAALVIRPGSDVFSVYAIFPLLAALSYSGYALTTRFVGRDEDAWTSLIYTGLFGAVVLSLFVPARLPAMDTGALALMAALVGFGTAGQLCLIRALAIGEASMLAPFAYVGLIGAALWGLLFFDEVPDGFTILGAVLIAAAGVYVWYRESRAGPRH